MKKNTKWYRLRHKISVNLCKPFMRLHYKRKYNFKAKPISLPKGATLVLCNHQTTDDPTMVLFSLKQLAYSMVAKDFIKLKNRKLLEFWYHPVWKDKTLKDLAAVKQTLKVLKEGNNLIIFPEGNRTFSGDECYIAPSIAKIIKTTKCNVVFLNFIGGFGVEPRYSTTIRKGSMTLKERKVILSDEVSKMSETEIYNEVIENLKVTEAPSEQAFVSDKRAEKLERVLYRCPCCKKIGTIYSKGNDVCCSSCSLKVTYGPHLTFENPSDSSFAYKTVADWYFDQYDFVRNYKITDNEIIFQDESAILDEIGLSFETKLNEGKLTLSNKELNINGQTFKIEDIIDATASGKQTFLFYVDKKTYRIRSDVEGFNALKYVNMFYHIVHTKKNQSDDFLGI